MAKAKKVVKSKKSKGKMMESKAVMMKEGEMPSGGMMNRKKKVDTYGIKYLKEK